MYADQNKAHTTDVLRAAQARTTTIFCHAYGYTFKSMGEFSPYYAKIFRGSKLVALAVVKNRTNPIGSPIYREGFSLDINKVEKLLKEAYKESVVPLLVVNFAQEILWMNVRKHHASLVKDRLQRADRDEKADPAYHVSLDLFSPLPDSEVEEKPKVKPRVSKRGCEHCPLKQKHDRGNSVFGKIRQRPILIWAQAPGKVEVEKGIPLVGPAGRFFWEKAEEHGLKREFCDVDTAIRCRPTEYSEVGNIIDRAPTRQEIRCCSLHSEAQLAKAKPKVILLLGRVAQKAILGKLSKQGKEVYWLNDTPVVCAPHPSYFLRGGSREAEKQLATALDLAMVHYRSEKPDKLWFLKTLDHKRLETIKDVRLYFESLTLPTAVDIEDGWVDKYGEACEPGKGRHVVLCIGFCQKPGIARVIFLDHPEALAERRKQGREFATDKLRGAVAEFLQDPKHRKIFWFGVTDVLKLQRLWKIQVEGYYYEAMLAEYLRYPDRKDYSLERTAEVRFKEFSGWKQVVDPYVGNPQNYARVPIEALLIRNAGDVDITKRVQLTNRKFVNPPLMDMLIQASFPLYKMELRGIPLDYKHADILSKVYRPLKEKLVGDIRMVAGDPELEIKDNTIRWLLFKKLKLPVIARSKKTQVPSVGKEILEQLIHRHPVVLKILQWRFTSKLLSTYLQGFLRSADNNGGRVKTRFKLHGTGTGRLSSGGGKDDPTRVNFQNLHGDASVQNILVADANWRQVVDAYSE